MFNAAIRDENKDFFDTKINWLKILYCIISLVFITYSSDSKSDDSCFEGEIECINAPDEHSFINYGDNTSITYAFKTDTDKQDSVLEIWLYNPNQSRNPLLIAKYADKKWLYNNQDKFSVKCHKNILNITVMSLDKWSDGTIRINALNNTGAAVTHDTWLTRDYASPQCVSIPHTYICSNYLSYDSVKILDGPGVKKIDNENYQLAIPPNKNHNRFKFTFQLEGISSDSAKQFNYITVEQYFGHFLEKGMP